jgi:hypothetical protein
MQKIIKNNPVWPFTMRHLPVIQSKISNRKSGKVTFVGDPNPEAFSEEGYRRPNHHFVRLARCLSEPYPPL